MKKLFFSVVFFWFSLIFGTVAVLTVGNVLNNFANGRILHVGHVLEALFMLVCTYGMSVVAVVTLYCSVQFMHELFQTLIELRNVPKQK